MLVAGGFGELGPGGGEVSAKAFRVVQLWNVSLLSRELMEHVVLAIVLWSVPRIEAGAFFVAHEPRTKGAVVSVPDHLRLDKEVDDYLIANGAEQGSEIVWHLWY